MTQSAQIGEQWSFIRDFQTRGISRDDARELFHITQVEFEPPSRAHKKRLLKRRPLVLHARPEKAPDHSTHLKFNAVRADATEIVRILRPGFRQPVTEPNPPRPTEIHIERPQPGDAERKAAHARNELRKDHLRALGRCKSKFLLTAKLSMEIIELFGSFEEYAK